MKQPQPPHLRIAAVDELNRARERDSNAWPRHDVENAFARAQVLASLAVEEQIERLRLQVVFSSVCVLVVLLSIAIEVS